ncbi:MAG: bifunctional metallophosphatase/5'-nucleotidase [Bacteroidetes bacterium]|nr:MAG: bifunctional metallophosphatase/5'-nucleotidase [Bacteroidota bacterium]
MNTAYRILLPLIVLALASCDTTRKAGASKQDDGVIEIVFLQMNDVYEITPLSDNTGGLARVSALRKSLLAKNPNTFTVLAGDFISPSVIGTLKYEGKRIRGRQMVEVMNTLGLDWVVFGNHEFDYDLEDLQARLDESNFTWLAANARQKSGDQLHPFVRHRPDGDVPCPDDLVVDVTDSDGTTIRLGVFGVLVTSGQKSYVAYSDPLEKAQQRWQALKDKTDICIGLTHLDVADDKKLADLLPEVPLIMGGHDHDNMYHRVGKTVVAKADANARTVYVHHLRYDKKTGQATVRSELRKIDASIPNEPATAQVVDKWGRIMVDALKSAGVDAHRQVTVLQEPLDCREAIVRHTQAPVGQLITQAMLSVAHKKADCAILNGGSIRVDDVLSGALTELDIVRMLPFGGGISEVDMRGTLLQRVLDAGLGNKGKGGYLHLAGIARNEPSGIWEVAGQALDANRTYRVVLPDFLLTGLETNMDFLKAEPSGSGTTNPDILSIDRPQKGNTDDIRRDIRLVLIQYLQSGK